MFSIISFYPDEVNGNLKDKSQEYEREPVIRSILQTLKRGVPVRVGVDTKQISNNLQPESKCKWASKEEMVSRLIWLTTVKTSLRLTPLACTVACRQSITNCKPGDKSISRNSLWEPYYLAPLNSTSWTSDLVPRIRWCCLGIWRFKDIILRNISCIRKFSNDFVDIEAKCHGVQTVSSFDASRYRRERVLDTCSNNLEMEISIVPIYSSPFVCVSLFGQLCMYHVMILYVSSDIEGNASKSRLLLTLFSSSWNCICIYNSIIHIIKHDRCEVQYFRKSAHTHFC